MPSNRGVSGLHWNPKPDIAPLSYRVQPHISQPHTKDEIRNWLEDTGASALALANQFVDPATAAEALDDMALRVHEDVRGGYFPLEIAVQRQQARELGHTAFCYLEYKDGSSEAWAG